jgi:hypothetical protein
MYIYYVVTRSTLLCSNASPMQSFCVAVIFMMLCYVARCVTMKDTAVHFEFGCECRLLLIIGTAN